MKPRSESSDSADSGKEPFKVICGDSSKPISGQRAQSVPVPADAHLSTSSDPRLGAPSTRATLDSSVVQSCAPDSRRLVGYALDTRHSRTHSARYQLAREA